MSNTLERRNLTDEMNRCMPAAAHVKLGDLLQELIVKHNALVAEVAAGSTDVAHLAIVPLSER